MIQVALLSPSSFSPVYNWESHRHSELTAVTVSVMGRGGIWTQAFSVQSPAFNSYYLAWIGGQLPFCLGNKNIRKKPKLRLLLPSSGLGPSSKYVMLHFWRRHRVFDSNGLYQVLNSDWSLSCHPTLLPRLEVFSSHPSLTVCVKVLLMK